MSEWTIKSMGGDDWELYDPDGKSAGTLRPGAQTERVLAILNAAERDTRKRGEGAMSEKTAQLVSLIRDAYSEAAWFNAVHHSDENARTKHKLISVLSQASALAVEIDAQAQEVKALVKALERARESLVHNIASGIERDTGRSYKWAVGVVTSPGSRPIIIEEIGNALAPFKKERKP